MTSPAAQKAAEALRQAPADQTPTSLPGFYYIRYTGIRAEALAALEAEAAPSTGGQNRDQDTGRFTFEGKWSRLCKCGHELGVHTAAAPHECMNADRQAIMADWSGEPGQACDCKRFRPRRSGRPSIAPRGP